jgi:thiamine pyrophosphokinase
MAQYDPPVRTPDPEPYAPRHAIVVADGDVPARAALDEAWPGWAVGADAVIAADGGLAGAYALGLQPTLLVGDLDSVDPALAGRAESAGLRVMRVPPAKDESDTELALLEALRSGARRVTIVGALGGDRVDHELANVWLLAHPAASRAEVTLLDARTRVSLAEAGAGSRPATRDLPGRVGATVSLLPFGGDAVGVTTHGLRYPLRDEPLATGPARGVSNVRDAPDATLTVREGRLLIVETPF